MRSAFIAAGLSIGLLVPQAALACGGFFCGGTPIDQTGEDILFAVDEEDSQSLSHCRLTRSIRSDHADRATSMDPGAARMPALSKKGQGAVIVTSTAPSNSSFQASTTR